MASARYVFLLREGVAVSEHRNIIYEDTSTYLLNCLLVTFEFGRRQERHIVQAVHSYKGAYFVDAVVGARVVGTYGKEPF